MWFASFSGLVLITAASAWPIRVHQPTAVTSPPAAQLSAEQIDYLLKHYIGTGSTNAPRLILTPPHHDYVPIDSDFIKSTNPKLRQPASAASGVSPAITKLEEHSSYFVPTIRPYGSGAHTPSGYDFYFPQADDIRPEDDATAVGHQSGAADLNLTYLRNMQPPAQPSSDEEPNYYAALKVNGGNKKAPPKKFNSTKKQVNLKGKATVAKLQAAGAGRDEVRGGGGDSSVAEDEYMYVGQATHQQEFVTREPAERLTPKSAMRTLRAEELNTGEYLPSVLRNGNANGNRIAYQMHGFNGPQSYRFGYDTGKGENRQFRIEQRDKDGNVIGEYGYKDGLGKMNVFKYTSRADEGFRSKQVL